MNTSNKSVRRGRDRMVMGLTNTCAITNVVSSNSEVHSMQHYVRLLV